MSNQERKIRAIIPIATAATILGGSIYGMIRSENEQDSIEKNTGSSLERSINLRDLNEDLDSTIKKFSQSQQLYVESHIETIADLDAVPLREELNSQLEIIRTQILGISDNIKIEQIKENLKSLQSDIINDPDYKIVSQVEHDQRWWERANAASILGTFFSGFHLFFTPLAYFSRRRRSLIQQKNSNPAKNLS